MQVSEIDFSRIPQEVIRKFLRNSNLETLEELLPVCYVEAKEPYSRHQKEYIFPFNIEAAWQKYIFLSPTACWDSEMISFGLMYSRSQDKILYRDGAFDKLQPGQLYFISLKILGTILQIPVMHEINKVDHENKIIQTCYLEKGKSEGSQWIRLSKIDDYHTRVIHETIYKGDSKIREKYFYPYFHTKAIDQFHGNIQRALSDEASSSSILTTSS